MCELCVSLLAIKEMNRVYFFSMPLVYNRIGGTLEDVLEIEQIVLLSSTLFSFCFLEHFGQSLPTIIE